MNCFIRVHQGGFSRLPQVNSLMEGRAQTPALGPGAGERNQPTGRCHRSWALGGLAGRLGLQACAPWDTRGLEIRPRWNIEGESGLLALPCRTQEIGLFR